MRAEKFMAMKNYTVDSSDMIPCNFVDGYRAFRGIFCIYLLNINHDDCSSFSETLLNIYKIIMRHAAEDPIGRNSNFTCIETNTARWTPERRENSSIPARNRTQFFGYSVHRLLSTSMELPLFR
jgi:hypothetical protein